MLMYASFTIFYLSNVFLWIYWDNIPQLYAKVCLFLLSLFLQGNHIVVHFNYAFSLFSMFSNNHTFVLECDSILLCFLMIQVKLSVQGVSAAAEAMNAMQSSFQTLEHGLLLKVILWCVRNFCYLVPFAELGIVSVQVNTAFEKANTATQTVKCFQQSLQSLENNAMKKVQ